MTESEGERRMHIFLGDNVWGHGLLTDIKSRNRKQ